MAHRPGSTFALDNGLVPCWRQAIIKNNNVLLFSIQNRGIFHRTQKSPQNGISVNHKHFHPGLEVSKELVISHTYVTIVNVTGCLIPTDMITFYIPAKTIERMSKYFIAYDCRCFVEQFREIVASTFESPGCARTVSPQTARQF